MNKTLCTMVMMTSVLLGSCNCENGKVDTGKGQGALIGKSEMKIDDGRMTAEALWAMGRIGGVKVSPDGSKILYSVGYYSVPQNKSNAVVTHSSQCLYIKSVTMMPEVLSKSGYLSWVLGIVLIWAMNNRCFSSGEKENPSIRKKVGKEYALSTNSDIYVYDLASKQTTNVSEGIMGYDTNPQYSPDGKYIAWLSMERDGYESDQNRLMVLDIATGERRFASKDFESSLTGFCWKADSKSVYFTGVWHGEIQIYEADVTACSVRPITSGMYDYSDVSLLGDKLLALRHSMSAADEIYTVSPENGETTQLSFENKHLFDQMEMGKVEGRWMKTTDGKEMLSWIIYPPHFDPNKKYPTLLFCEGGPQSPVSQFWSYRWNFQIMAAHDYIIVAPNRRGLPGFGKEWLEEISGDYGGQCMKDYFTAIDELAKEPFVDKDRLGCVGASFGGFSVYWLAGHHDKRFKAFIAHDGIFNMEMQYLETEEMWFANWDMGGAYWDKQNAIAQRTFANSPHKFVDKWDTPILCIHGEKDYRILANQAMAAFNAAVLRGVPAELLIYPDENHWVLQPQNGVLWQRTFFEWLDKWLKK